MKKCKTCGKTLKDEEVILCKCGNTMCLSCMIKDGRCKKCMEVVKTGKLPDTIRRSYIDVYEKCPYRFYLEVIKGLPVPPSAYAEVGIALHDLFEKYSLNETLNLAQMREEYDEIESKMDKNMFKDDNFRAEMYDRAQICMANFFIMNKDSPPPYMTEKRLYLKMGENLPEVSIAMDRINKLEYNCVESDNNYEVVDYKTGKPLVGKQLSASLQVPLYILIIQENLGIKVQRFVLQYLFKGVTRVFERIDNDRFQCKVRKNLYVVSLDKTKKRVQHVFQKMKNKQYNITTKQNSFNCNFCPFSHDGTCEGKESRLWKQ